MICAAAVLHGPVHAQQMPQKESAPKPALSASESVLLQWNDIGRKLIAMAEDFPENKYDFKPTPVMQSFCRTTDSRCPREPVLHQCTSRTEGACDG